MSALFGRGEREARGGCDFFLITQVIRIESDVAQEDVRDIVFSGFLSGGDLVVVDLVLIRTCQEYFLLIHSVMGHNYLRRPVDLLTLLVFWLLRGASVANALPVQLHKVLRFGQVANLGIGERQRGVDLRAVYLGPPFHPLCVLISADGFTPLLLFDVVLTLLQKIIDDHLLRGQVVE